MYARVVPKLWTETIETHRRTVREAILHATVALVGEHGPRSVTMSQVAEKAGIGRATLYKYFPDVEAILLTWHEGQVNDHLEHLARVRDRGGRAPERLDAVLTAYAQIFRRQRAHRHTELWAFLHRDEHLAAARRKLHAMVEDLLVQAAEAGGVRDDVAADELASYCLHSLEAAGDLRSEAAVHRLVTVTLAGLRPPDTPESPRG